MAIRGTVSQFPESAQPQEMRGLPARKLTFYEKLFVQHAHPPKLILDTIAYMWSIYFFGRHQAAAAVAVLIGVGGLGSLLAARKNMEALAKTALGRFFLVSAHPVNALCQVAGYTIVAIGAWQHSAAVVLAGVTYVLVGHLWGWRNVA